MFRNTVITFALDDDIREFEVGKLQLWLWELKSNHPLKLETYLALFVNIKLILIMNDIQS